MRRLIALTTLFVISFNSCSSLRINKTINKEVPSQTENLIKDFSGKYYLTVSFGEPFGDIDANLELYYDNSTIQSVMSYFDGDKYIPVKVNSTELFDGAIFINLEDQDSSLETRDEHSENITSDHEKENKPNSEDDAENIKDEDDAIDKSIESIPFISEPVKKKRTRSSK